MNNKRILEILFICFVVSLLAQWMQDKPPAQEEPEQRKPEVVTRGEQPAQPSAKLPIAMGDVVPDFQLNNAQGEAVVHKAGTGPLLVTLTATGCGDCIQRIDKEDATAYEMAAKSGVPVWNMLVYHPDNQAASFVQSHNPVADEVVADPTSQTSVRMLGGSDATCWLLLDKEGRLAYRGPVSLDNLERELRAL